MNDRAVELLEQYEIEVLRTRKGRGAIVCDTNQGCLIFKEYTAFHRIYRTGRCLRRRGFFHGKAVCPTARNFRL